jgi:hypothetical protein
MSWVRLMSIIEPQTYLQNKTIKNPFLVSLLCWLYQDYPDGQCYNVKFLINQFTYNLF